ncbi:XdhC family protein [Halobacterium bonnevillei]|uniref:XdhC/CoxI family protein n=1 Tax=Halobacterium bonnevillei TaxID=2692200 RepID=A0A6B0SPH2_9EURY|nr:XdhC/CoxI family protein [Halobacterium bonnevillei]MXR22366.1 XdhC/CoxI family protein [Halobacterium bonnevillei]
MTETNWSVPETEVVQRVHERLDAAGTDVLATVVDVEGNAYRRPGAKMLLDDDGPGVGSITAGCLEDELRAAATGVRERGEPETITYDLMEDEADVWGMGVGCNGVIDVLLEPLDETYRPAVEAFADGRDVAVLTVLSGGVDGFEYGDRVYYDPDDGGLVRPDGSPAEEWPHATLTSMADDLARRGRADTVTVDAGDGATLEVFVDGIAAPAELVVFGTGHDVGPVTELAAKNDFRVTVAGFRGGLDLADRFPDATRTVTTSPGSLEDDLQLDERTHAVVMTHNFVDDRLALETLLESPAPYVGLMGPRERFEEMLDAFADEGRVFAEDALESLYTPIGLDLGGGSPYQIAHSIVAEVLAVENDRTPRHLREREGHIHDRVDAAADVGAGPTPE